MSSEGSSAQIVSLHADRVVLEDGHFHIMTQRSSYVSLLASLQGFSICLLVKYDKHALMSLVITVPER